MEQAADMDDSEKQEIVGVLMKEQTNLAMRLNREQTRQEEMVSFQRRFHEKCVVFMRNNNPQNPHLIKEIFIDRISLSLL